MLWSFIFILQLFETFSTINTSKTEAEEKNIEYASQIEFFKCNWLAWIKKVVLVTEDIRTKPVPLLS